MKPTTSHHKCFSAARGLSHTGITRGAQRAHTPQRHATGPAGLLDHGPRMTASGRHLAYVESKPARGGGPSDRSGDPAGQPHVLHVDIDSSSAFVLTSLLAPEARVTHAATVGDARRMLESNVFSLVVLDPALPDGDARTLLSLLSGTPLLVYAVDQPEWRDTQLSYLPKPWTSTRQLWVTISTLLGLPGILASGDRP